MIIKSISAENFGKFDRYSVNLDDNINVFYGDNEAGKTTLYEIISILLFAPQTDKEMAASNKLIKTDEKYARVYAIINIDGKEISIAREIYFNNTNLSIADQDNVSSLGNVNVPFIGELSKEMYESFHTIDYYNMATITNNVWDQIINVIEESHGAERITPDYSSPEDEKGEMAKSSFEDDIKAKEAEKSKLQKSLKDAQKKQKRMIRNQDKIDDLIGELEDVENNIELETSYLKEAEKMNQIRSTIKKTQDLTLELEKYKNLKPWLPNLRKYYERLKLYSENVANGIENPIDMFDDLEEKPEEQTEVSESVRKDTEQQDSAAKEKAEPETKTQEQVEAEENNEPAAETKTPDQEEKETEKAGSEKEQTIQPEVEPEIKEDYKYTPVTLPSEKDYNLAKEKINKFIEDSYLNKETADQKYQEEPKTQEQAETEEKIKAEIEVEEKAAPEAAAEEKPEIEAVAEEKPEPVEIQAAEAEIEVKEKEEEPEEQAEAIEEKIKPQFDFKQIKKVEVEPATKEDEPIDIEPLADIAPMDQFEPEAETEEKQETQEQELPPDVKPLSIRKPRDMRNQKDEEQDDERDEYTNRYGQTNPYSDNVFPDMNNVNYSGKNLPKVKKDDEDENEKDKYSLSTSNNELPTQSQQVPEADMEEEQQVDPLLKAEEYLNNVDMKEIIAASKETVEVDGETQDQIDKAQLRYKVIGQRVFEQQEMDMEDITAQLKNLDTNAIYKTIVKFKGLSQKQRKAEHTVVKVEKQASKNNTTSIILGVVAFFSMMLGLACFFIEQIINAVPSSELTNIIYNVIKGLPLNNIIPGNILSGGAFVLIAVLLTIAIILGNDSEDEVGGEQQVADEVQLEDLKNNIRLAKREVVDSLMGFPLPASYLENPNNSIITVINELREAEKAYREIVHESKMPKNAEYRKMWELAKANLTEEEISEDLFDNISRLRRKIQDYKEDQQEKERKQKDAKLGINMITSSARSSDRNNDILGQSSSFGLSSSQETERSEAQSDIPLGSFGITPVNEQSERNASESSSFVLPTTQSQNVGASDYSSQPTGETSMDSLYPQAEEKDFSYPSSSDAPDTTPDNSYLGSDTQVDNSYPDSGGIFGAVKDDNYPSADDEFGKLQDSGYAFNDSDTSSNFSYPEKDDIQPEASADDFGIPGINRYSGDTPSQSQSESKIENDPFGIPGINRYSSDTAAQTDSLEDNPYGIPGIKKYSNDYQSTNDEKTEDDPYGIPGVHKYTSDSSTEQDSSSNDDPFGIPGVHRYTSYDNQAEEQNTQSSSFDIPGVNDYSNAEDTATSSAEDFGIPGIKRYNSMESQSQESAVEDHLTKENEAEQSSDKNFGGFPSGLPGMDKFSNRADNEEETNPFKKIKDALPGEPKHEPEADAADMAAEAVVDTAENAVDAAETVPFAGAVFSGGLPGLDKFSNRGEQKKVEEEKPQEQPEMEVQPEQEPAATQEQPIEDAVIETVAPEEVAAEQTETVVQEAEEITDEVKPEENQAPAEQVKAEEPIKTEAQIEEPEAENPLETETETEEQVLEAEAEQEKPVVKQKDRRQKEYDELLALLGNDPEATIREVEQLTRDLHRQVTQRDEGMAELLKLNDAAVRLSTLSSNKWPYKQKAIDASMERIDYLEADKLKIGRHLKMLEEKIENEAYENTPQAIADRLKTLDEEIDQLKLENDKHALAEELIEKQKLLDMSSKDDRSHIIEDTSVYMKELTLGKYVEVKINDDQSGLSICDKDGQWFDTTKDRLSQATREQLYLALRISIADLFDEKSLIFPMFFDEALITWDKRRMKAVMRLLSKMSMHRQVIIFTCHDWLKDMISDYLIGAKIIMM